jgi:Fibronectin type III domain
VVGPGYMFDADVNLADDDADGPNATPNSTLDEDNGYAHIFEPAMGTATFVYTYNSPDNGGVQYWTSVAAAFAQAASTNSTPPSVPQNLSVSGVTSSSVMLSWSASTDPNYASSTLSYLIYRNGVQVGATVGGTTTYTDTGLASATTYTYTVSASDPIGNASAQSQAVNAATSSSPPDNQISRR